ncbi:MAG: hypothetical protein WCS04_07955, partial [Sphaerochaetaceae bacterium]
MDDSQIKTLKSYYETYNDVIKPLIAVYEAREQQFPTPIFNEIRAFNDHVSRCYLEDSNPDFINKQLKRAGRHISRIILDLYKYLIVSFDDTIKRFEKKTRNVDLSIISDGQFYVNFSGLRNNAINAIRTAKRLESSTSNGEDVIFAQFETGFNYYQETVELIDSNFAQINWAKTKSL